MDEIAKLAETVKILAQTQETMIGRQEQLFRMQEERLNAFLEKFPAIEERLKQIADQQEILNQALTDSLSDQDSQIDDLAKVTAALLMLQKEMQAEEPAAVQ